MTNRSEQQEHLLHYQRLLLDEIIVTSAYVKAMASVAIGADFHQYEIPVIHDYLGGMHGLLEKLDTLQQQLMRTLYSDRLLGEK